MTKPGRSWKDGILLTPVANRPIVQAVDVMDQNPQKHHMLPVWFFVGIILLVYGLLILASGVYELSHPPATVLSNLHAPIWWGALLAVIGAIYTVLFAPRRG